MVPHKTLNTVTHLLLCYFLQNFSIEENEPELVALNLFICLIGKYFGQRDLAD